jgi:hypothetical protein
MSRSAQPLIPLQTAVIGGYVMDEQDSDGTHYNLPRDSDLNFSAILKALRGNTLPPRQHNAQHREFVSCVGGCSMGQDRPLHAVTRGATRDKHGRPHASSCRCHVDDELCERSASHSAGDLAAQSLS